LTPSSFRREYCQIASNFEWLCDPKTSYGSQIGHVSGLIKLYKDLFNELSSQETDIDYFSPDSTRDFLCRLGNELSEHEYDWKVINSVGTFGGTLLTNYERILKKTYENNKKKESSIPSQIDQELMQSIDNVLSVHEVKSYNQLYEMLGKNAKQAKCVSINMYERSVGPDNIALGQAHIDAHLDYACTETYFSQKIRDGLTMVQEMLLILPDVITEIMSDSKKETEILYMATKLDPCLDDYGHVFHRRAQNVLNEIKSICHILYQ